MKRVPSLLLLSGLLFPCSKIDAQIYYQDIIPDTTISTWSGRDIHIDSAWTSLLSYGDPANLTIWQEFDAQIIINAFSDCEVVMDGLYPAAMNVDDLIGPSSTWQAPDYEIMNNGTEGNWMGVTDKYIGVRVQSGANWLYGWIRLDVITAGTSVTIKDYACNRTVNTAINAGQSVAGMDEMNNTSGPMSAIFPNPFYSVATLTIDQHVDNAILVIYDPTGHVVKTMKNISGNQVKIERENLCPGLYFFELTTESGILYTGRLFVAQQ